MTDAQKETEEFRVDSLETYIALTSRLRVLFGANAWYRGQSDLAWALLPAVARIPYRAWYEPNRSINFMNRARTRHHRCPDPADYAGWLFLMQHYGLCTHLLDWSESPLVALFFAVESLSITDAAVFVLDPHKLNVAFGCGTGMLLPHHPEVDKLIRPAFKTLEPIAMVAAILPPEVDNRMLLQRSAFTIHGDQQSLDANENAHQFLAKLTIPSASKRLLKGQLAALAIDRSYLFPDLANLALHLNNEANPAP